MRTNQEFIAYLESGGVLRSPRIKQALERFPREYFVPPKLIRQAYEDYPLPIGEGQTISQPYTVVFMLEELKVKTGDKVLEIGAGSGWQTALLSYLVGKNGHVWAYEIRKPVAKFGRANLASLRNVDYVCGDASAHWRKHTPYNRIIAGAAFGDTNETKRLASLLTKNGRLVAPTMENDVRVIERLGQNKFKEEIYPGFVFVPMMR